MYNNTNKYYTPVSFTPATCKYYLDLHGEATTVEVCVVVGKYVHYTVPQGVGNGTVHNIGCGVGSSKGRGIGEGILPSGIDLGGVTVDTGVG